MNDIESDRPSFHDQQNKRGAWTDLTHYLVNNSEVLSLVVNISRGWKAQQAHNTSGVNVDPATLPQSAMTAQEAAAKLKLQQQYLPGYLRRVRELIDTCLRYEIKPVFITQPLLYGDGIDSVTNADLATIQHKDMSGKCAWQVLQLYNDEVRKICAEKRVEMIDLAKLMPKNSLYFYDEAHFTNAGTEKVAEIINEALDPWLANTFPGFKK